MNLNSSTVNNIRNKILFTFLLLVVYRIASQVPVPGVDGKALKEFVDSGNQGIFNLLNVFSGGSFLRFSVLALGIMPYITTSIIFSLLGEVIPKISEMQNDPDGYKQIQKITRYCTILLCLIQGYAYSAIFINANLKSGLQVVPEPDLFFRISTLITLTTGTMFLLWLGERITEFGLENGVSLIVFAGIAAALPGEIVQKFTLFQSGELSGLGLLISTAIIVFSFYIVCYVEKAYRNVPVQYAKKIVNNRVYGGSQSLPIKVDTAGVMPAILASSLLSAPATLANFVSGSTGQFKSLLDDIVYSLVPGNTLFNVVFCVLIFYMTYFYAPIQFKTTKISENLQKNNAFIPGIRPGAKTKEFLDSALFRLCFFGASFIALICILPNIISSKLNVQTSLGGTALLILVSVAIRVLINLQSLAFSDKYDSAFKVKGKYSGTNKRF